MRTTWRMRIIAVLMGCLVGPYSGLLPSPVAAVAVSALVLALPALISVWLDHALPRRTVVVAGVGAIALVAGGLLVAGAAFPSIWQGYSREAGTISLVVEMLLTPFVAAFALGMAGTPKEPGAAQGNVGATYAVLAWAGIGLQGAVLPYLIPLGRAYVDVLFLHTPSGSGGLAYGFEVMTGMVVLGAVGLFYGVGFVLASFEGSVGSALRRRLLPKGQHLPRHLNLAPGAQS